MIYLDHQATTPLAPEARAAMLPWLGGPGEAGFGNPHSPHRMGRTAAAAVEVAREQVAALLPPGGRVVFTSGATEAINLALRGSAGEGPVATSGIEHAAVLDTASAIGPHHLLPVDGAGICPVQPLVPGTRMVAVMHVNNEIGTVQPVARWAEAARATDALFLCDAVQSFGKLPLGEVLAGADFIAVSAHKIYGPKGIGALWVRDGVTLAPQITGGAQEGGCRSGTLSPALVAGFGAAASVAAERMAADADHARMLFDALRTLLGDWTLNGDAEQRWPGNLNLRHPGFDVGRALSECRDLMFSAGSACASGSGRPSHVLSAIGLSRAEARSSLRIGTGRYTTLAEVEAAAARLSAAARAQEAA